MREATYITWLCFVLVGIVVGLIMRRRGGGIVFDLVTGIIGGVLGGAAFEYLFKDLFVGYVDMAKWSLYASLGIAFAGAVILMLIKRAASGGGTS